MFIRSVSVTYGRTINTGNYSSAKFEVTLTADLDHDDSTCEIVNTLQEHAREYVKAEYARLKNATAPAVSPPDPES